MIAGNVRFPASSATSSGSTFAMQGDWINPVTDYSASGVKTSTTTVSQTLAGSTTVYLTDVSTFRASHGISIVGAGTAGADHTTTIASVNTGSSYVVLNVATVTTVNAGATVYHDDTVALQNAFNDGHLASCYLAGDFITTRKLQTPKFGQIIVGRNRFGNWIEPRDTVAPIYTNTNRLSTIWTRFNNDDGLRVSSNCVTLNGFAISQHPSVTRTGYAQLQVGSRTLNDGTLHEVNTGGIVNVANIINMRTMSGWIGINLGYGFDFCFDQIYIGDYLKHAVNIDIPVPYGGNRFSRFMMWGNGTGMTLGANTDYAINITQSDLNFWSELHCWRVKGLMRINPTVSAVLLQAVSTCNIDGIVGGYGFVVQGSAGLCYGNTFQTGTINCNTAAGVAYFGTNTKKNIMKGFVWAGASKTITDLGTNNDVITGNNDYGA